MNFNIVNDREKVKIMGEEFLFYDVNSKKDIKDRQFGFKIYMSNGKTLVCNGDETLREENFDIVENVDYLIHEAFCLDEEKDVKKPYDKGHATAKDVCEMAQKLNVKNLVLYHIADDDLINRKEKYLKKNKEFFNGNLFVPNDLEIIDI